MFYDFIIIGGGAVGLFLAKSLKEKWGRNASVLVLERKKEVGGKLCSGLVSEKFFDLLSEDKKEQNLIKDILIEREFNSARIYVENKFFNFEGRAFAIKRKKLEKILLEESINLGVDVQFSSDVIKIEEKTKFVNIWVKSGKHYQGKILAGCDGAISFTASQINLPRQKKVLLGVTTELPFSVFKDTLDVNFVSLFFSKNFPGFFAWQIPKKDIIEVGVALEPKYKPKQKLEKWLKDNFDVIINENSFKAALIPFYPLKKTISKRVFLCGDSAGMIKPYTGGGLIYGFEAAKIAAQTIDFRNPNLEIYEKDWRKILMPDIRIGNFLRKCYYLPSPVKKLGLFVLSKLAKISKIDQDRPTTIFKCRSK